MRDGTKLVRVYCAIWITETRRALDVNTYCYSLKLYSIKCRRRSHRHAGRSFHSEQVFPFYQTFPRRSSLDYRNTWLFPATLGPELCQKDPSRPARLYNTRYCLLFMEGRCKCIDFSENGCVCRFLYARKGVTLSVLICVYARV